jgi:hypothetical protein
LSIEDYLRLNGKYLREAEELLARGDYIQASEKLWGAAAEIVKAVAASRGVMLGTHKSLVRYVLELHKQNPGLGLRQGFAIAETLHINFYEDHLPEEEVRLRAEEVKSFINKMKELLKK